MKYSVFVNNLIKEEVSRAPNLIAFGQNINAGSCLGGLTRGLVPSSTGQIINTINAENTLCGFGFGLMMRGASGIFFMKQLDFLVLGLDHLVNTYNVIRNTELQNSGGSFTIMPLVVDSGYQGPQSSFNNFADMCSLARIQGFPITNSWDAKKIISAELIKPGFRIIGVSQRLMNEDIIDPGEPAYQNSENTVFQYAIGTDATVVCFNFSFPQGWKLKAELEAAGKKISIFNVNAMTPTNWEEIIKSVVKTGKLIVIDDSKSENLPGFALIAACAEAGSLKKYLLLRRNLGENWLNPVPDTMEIDSAKVLEFLRI
jgi:pyruvate dehydrogenase E1 component beta subunit